MSVIKVYRPDTGYAQIPNKFAQDERLSEGATAVGLYLACCPDGHKIRPTDIQTKFSRRPGKPRGREWWARVAGELKSARYMWLNRTHGDDGKFSSDWIFCINGIQDDSLDSGSAVVGSGGIGPTAGGNAAARPDSVSKQEDVVQKRTTTTTTSAPRAALRPPHATTSALPSSGGGLCRNENITFEPILEQMGLVSQVASIIDAAGLEAQLHQDLVDELAGVLDAGKQGGRQALVAPAAWFRVLVQKAQAGEFDPNFCRVVQRRRERVGRPIPSSAGQRGPESPDQEKRSETQLLAAQQHMAAIRAALSTKGKE